MMMRLHETSLFAVKIIDFPVFDESVTDGRTDGRTDRPSYRDARTHLKRKCNPHVSFAARLSFCFIFDLDLNIRKRLRRDTYWKRVFFRGKMAAHISVAKLDLYDLNLDPWQDSLDRKKLFRS